jgi:hypothetical protein
MPDTGLEDRDDVLLRESLDRMATSAGSAARSLRPAVDVRRRGVTLHRRRAARTVLGAGLALLAVAGVVGGSGILRTAPQPAVPVRPTVALPTPAPAASPPPTGPTMIPGGGPGSQYAEITKVRDLGNGRIEITVDGKRWLRGADREAYIKEHGTPQCDGECQLILEDGKPPWTVVLDAKVRFRGTSVFVGDGNSTADGVNVTARQFLANTRTWLSQGGTPVPVWLFHTRADLSSPVVAVYEQYFP